NLRSALGWPAAPRRWLDVSNQALGCHRKRHEAGERGALWDAIDILATIFFPAWVQDGYSEFRTYCHLRNLEALLQALGLERLKGKHHDRAQRREELRQEIVFRVYQLHATEDAPFDRETFVKVGDELGISGGEVEKIFGEPASKALREILRNLRIS